MLGGKSALPFLKKKPKISRHFFNVKRLTLPLAQMKASLNWILNGKSNVLTSHERLQEADTLGPGRDPYCVGRGPRNSLPLVWVSYLLHSK